MGFIYLMIIICDLMKTIPFWIVVGSLITWFIVSGILKNKLPDPGKKTITIISGIVNGTLVFCLVVVAIFTIVLCFVPISFM